MNQTIGILYICTGPYVLFWEDFYKSFENNFLPTYEKKYFVFTDADNIYAEESKNVERIYIENQPWPLITLFRFSTFLKIEDKLKKLNYLMFSNANMVCGEKVTPEEFLPRIEYNENLSVTLHPGYYGVSKLNFPYERSENSSAYIPWNCGGFYVIGAMYSGTSEAFLRMSKTLKRNIEEDLKKNKIALFHDESQLNRYIIGKPGVRIISPSYCYPCGKVVMLPELKTYSKKIYAVSKQEKFDVKTFKGHYDTRRSSIRCFLGKIKRKMLFKEHVLYIRDSILRCKLGEIKDAE